MYIFGVESKPELNSYFSDLEKNSAKKIFSGSGIAQYDAFENSLFKERFSVYDSPLGAIDFPIDALTKGELHFKNYLQLQSSHVLAVHSGAQLPVIIDDTITLNQFKVLKELSLDDYLGYFIDLNLVNSIFKNDELVKYTSYLVESETNFLLDFYIKNK